MLTEADVEIKVLSSIRTVKDLHQVQEFGITRDSFLLYTEVYDYMVEFIQLYQELPKPSDIEAKFNGTDSEIIIEEPSNLEYYLTEMTKLVLARNTRNVVRTRLGDNCLNLDNNPEETTRLLMTDLQKLQHTRSRNIAMLDKDALNRLQTLRDRIQASSEGRIIGIPTGLRCFDDYQDGWQPGETIMEIGPKGSGKSWILMNHAAVAYYHGFRCLYFSPEMTWEECALRFDVLLAHHYQTELSHNKLKTGIMANLDEYREWLESLTERADFMCVDSVEAVGFTLTGMLAMMEEFQPDIVFLDGIHLVKDPKGEQTWNIIKSCSGGLKAWAQRNKRVVIWTGQVDREGMRNSSEPVMSGAQAAYSKAAVEDANRLISIGADSDDPYRRVFRVPNNRSGREWHDKQQLVFDVDIGHIEQTMVQEPFAFDPSEFEGEV